MKKGGQPGSMYFFGSNENPVNDEAMRGDAPEYVFTGLRKPEKDAQSIFAGKTELLELQDAKPQKAKSWIICPFSVMDANSNKMLYICEKTSPPTKEKTWRLVVTGKVSSFYDFKSLENARAVYWDMVRGIACWGSRTRLRELGFSKHVNYSSVNLKRGDWVYWDIPH